MWNQDHSLTLSLWAVRSFFVLWCLFALFGYMITDFYVEYNGITQAFQPILITLYLCLAVAIFLLYDLYQLLKNISDEKIFIAKNIAYLRSISWLCFLVGIITLVAAISYVPFLLVSIAFAFIALIVRVVKNVMAAAIVLKEENDYTI